MSEKVTNDPLEFLTDGLESVGQMSIKLADELGYIDNPDYIIIDPRGDVTSAYLPFIVDPQRTTINTYRWLSYDMQWTSMAEPNYQVLVYYDPTPPPLTAHQQIELLDELASQFDEDDLIRQVISAELIEWLYDNVTYPDIFAELMRMRTVAYRLEGHIDDLEELV